MFHSSLEVIETPLLKQLPWLRHAFFTRYGGVSEGRYQSLNCAEMSQDDPQHVAINLSRIAAHFSVPPAQLFTVSNVHGARAVVVDDLEIAYAALKADALVTKKSGLLLGLRSADCAIVLFADVYTKIIGVAHAGWRGAKGGILESTVNEMVKLGAKKAHIIAAISPCIQQASYEVDQAFYRQFLEESMANIAYFMPANQKERYLFNLPAYVTGRLSMLGITQVETTGIDTYRDERFFSCRRAKHLGEPDFGCHFSCLSLI